MDKRTFILSSMNTHLCLLRQINANSYRARSTIFFKRTLAEILLRTSASKKLEEVFGTLEYSSPEAIEQFYSPTLLSVLRAKNVSHLEGCFFCPKSQPFHAVHSDSGVYFPSLSAFDRTISAISCSLRSFFNQPH